MLRVTFVAGWALTIALTVGPVVDGGPTPDSLEQAWERTVAALRYLAGLEPALSSREPASIAAAVAATEAPIACPEAEPGCRDALLEALRLEVAGLQMELDGAATAAPRAPTASTPPTTGLDTTLREALTRVPGTNASAPPAPATTSSAPASAKVALEPEGYAADALRLGHALYRQGEFERALAAFATRKDEVEAAYWKARCLERLSRLDEARAAYAAVVASGATSWEAQRAAEDLQFLEWRVAFERRLDGRTPERKP